jgi:hypothetical protein
MTKQRPIGAVTVRSNIVLEPHRWDLVPGELLYELRRMSDATPLQKAEHMYYQRCSVCGRTIAEINVQGCDRCTHAPSPSAVANAQELQQRRVQEAVTRGQAENAQLSSKDPM